MRISALVWCAAFMAWSTILLTSRSIAAPRGGSLFTWTAILSGHRGHTPRVTRKWPNLLTHGADGDRGTLATVNAMGGVQSMVSNWMSREARSYMREHPEIRYQQALDIVLSRGFPPKQMSLAPAGMSWLKAIGIDEVDNYDPTEVWRRNTGLSLRTPLGYLCGEDDRTATNELAYVDVAAAPAPRRGSLTVIQGATGSGKSATLTGFLASMVALHNPDDVQLVLLDFKGTRAFRDFDKLPHTAAVFTDISTKPAEWLRAVRTVLDEEFDRRRQLLQNHGATNAFEYRERAVANPSMPPLPILVIVADEYREFLRGRPGELDEMFMTASAGQLIGVHLVLGTQVVGTEDSRFVSKLTWGVSLRARTAAASLAVLGDESAMRLPMPGVARLRHVGSSGSDSQPRTLAAFNTMEGLTHRWSDSQEAWVKEPASTAEYRLLRRLSQLTGTADDTLSNRFTAAVSGT